MTATRQPSTRTAVREWGLLRQRRFMLLFAGRTTSMFGNAFGPVAIAFGVLALPGATPATLSAVLAGQAVPQLGLMLFGGVIGDRFPRHRVLMAAEILSGCAFGAMAAMLLSGWAPLLLLVGAAVVAGSASALLLPTLTGVMPDVVDRAQLRQANALLRLGTNTANIGGIALAGAAVALLGPGIAVAVDAATYFVGAAFLGALRVGAGPVRRRAILADLREGISEFTARQWLWTVVGSAAFLNAGTAATFAVLGPVLAKQQFSGAVGWSVILAAYTVGMLVSVVAALRIRPARPLRTAVLVTPVLALPLVALGTSAPLALAAGAAFLAGAALNVFSVLWETTLQQRIPPGALARVTACNYVVALALKPVGIYLAGYAAVGMGAGPATIALGAVLLVAGLAPLVSPQVRELTEHSGEE